MSKTMRRGSNGSKEVHLIEHPWCFICGAERVKLELHHIKPVRNGGSSNLRNTCLLCSRCHKWYHEKYDKKLDEIKDLSEKETRKIFLKDVRQ